MSRIQLTELRSLLDEHCAAYVLVAVSNDGDAQAHVREPAACREHTP